MATYLLAWNPNRWQWDDLPERARKVEEEGSTVRRWSCANSKRIREGDRLFLIRQGEEPRGIFASGVADSDWYEDLHWDGTKAREGIMTHYVNVKFDVLLDAKERPILAREFLDVPPFSDQHWDTQYSGISIREHVARLCSRIYRRHQQAIDLIYRHRFAQQETVRDVVIGLIETNPSLIYDGLNTNYPDEYVAFWLHEWDSSVLRVARGWGRTGRILRFIVANYPDSLDLVLQLGPGDEEVRNRVLNMAHAHPDVFGAAPESLHQITSLYEKSLLTPEFYEDATDEDREEEIRRHWTDFLREDLPRIEAALSDEEWIWE